MVKALRSFTHKQECEVKAANLTCALVFLVKVIQKKVILRFTRKDDWKKKKNRLCELCCSRDQDKAS